MVDLVLQVNGKVRDKITLPAGTPQDEAKQAAMDNKRVRELIDGRQVVKAIVVPNKLVNIVVK